VRIDLTSGSACEDPVTTIAMKVQRAEAGETIEIVMPLEYAEALDVYKGVLEELGAGVVDVQKAGNKLVILARKL